MFPEVDYDKVDTIRGMDIVVCTSAKSTTRRARCCANSTCRSRTEETQKERPMAKKSAIEKNKKRKRWSPSMPTSARAEGNGQEPRPAAGRTVRGADEAVQAAAQRFEGPVRNRCEITGRPRGFYRKFKMSRIALRDLASLGLIPGVTKSSW